LEQPLLRGVSRVSFEDCTVSPWTDSRACLPTHKTDCTFIDSLGYNVYDLYLIITIPEPPGALLANANALPPPLPVFGAPGVGSVVRPE
jgi:hypothetical protein